MQDDSDEDERSKKIKIKKSNCNFGLLQAWYENLYCGSNVNNSPKKNKNSARKVLVVIIPDFESFNEKVLRDFILIARYVILQFFWIMSAV